MLCIGFPLVERPRELDEIRLIVSVKVSRPSADYRALFDEWLRFESQSFLEPSGRFHYSRP